MKRKAGRDTQRIEPLCIQCIEQLYILVAMVNEGPRRMTWIFEKFEIPRGNMKMRKLCRGLVEDLAAKGYLKKRKQGCGYVYEYDY